MQAIIAETAPLGARDIEEVNLKRLMMMTRDAELANRDWATFLLAQLELNRPDVIAALAACAADPAPIVREEAICGLAALDRVLALPLLRKELSGDCISMLVLEAAIVLADPSLVEDLEAFAAPSGDVFLDRLVQDALAACRTAPKSAPQTLPKA